MLALAHPWQGLIRSGAVRDQADLARLAGVARARVTQVMNLLGLAPDLQEAVLCDAAEGSVTEVTLRHVARQPVWCEQKGVWLRRRGSA